MSLCSPYASERRLHDVRVDRVKQRFARAEPTTPPTRGEFVTAKAYNRHVALPAARATPVLELDIGQIHPPANQSRDLSDGDVFPGARVEHLESLPTLIGQRQHRSDHVADVNVGLALLPVAQDAQRAGFVNQPAHEVVG